MSHQFTIVIQKEEDWYVAHCLENFVASQGKTIEEAISNVSEAIAFYYEDNDYVVVSPPLVTMCEVAI
ncbi:MAG: type II toxin-antitoxin system HicB family antitoxin [Clostridia bacterium]|nr:type II toxin-antitoxin system HicB family antitoxin [Clostridia bacterium]